MVLLLSIFSGHATVYASSEPPQCSKKGFYFLGSYSKIKHNRNGSIKKTTERGIISSHWSPARDPQFEDVFLSCSGAAAKVCRKAIGHMGLTIRSTRSQYSKLAVELSERDVISFQAKKLQFTSLWPSRVRENTEIVFYVNNGGAILCQHAVSVVP